MGHPFRLTKFHRFFNYAAIPRASFFTLPDGLGWPIGRLPPRARRCTIRAQRSCGECEVLHEHEHDHVIGAGIRVLIAKNRGW